METPISREEALALLKKYNKDSFHIQHAFKKKYKTKNFAAGCSREVIERGAEMLGWELETLQQRTIDAMKAVEESINQQMA